MVFDKKIIYYINFLRQDFWSINFNEEKKSSPIAYFRIVF